MLRIRSAARFHALFVVAVLMMGLTPTRMVSAATVADADLTQMISQVKRDGMVPVIVHLTPVSFSEMATNMAAAKTRVNSKAKALVDELGSTTKASGRWNSGMGQMGLNVTLDGLRLLQASSQAVSFRPGHPWNKRTPLFAWDGSLEEIERLLQLQGWVDVEVTLNVEGLEFDLLADAAIEFRASGTEVEKSGQALLNQLGEEDVFGKNSVQAMFSSLGGGRSQTNRSPVLNLRVNREGLERLASASQVRRLRPVGFVDSRPYKFDEEAISRAQKYGTAEVIVSIRTPLIGGQVPAKSRVEIEKAHSRVLSDIRATLGILSSMKDFSSLGVMTGFLTLNEINKLARSQDLRLLSVALNRAIGKPALTTSIASTNLSLAYNASIRGAGQYVVVFDSGVQKQHQMFRKANNTSKVVFEACFGSDGLGSDGVTTYQSLCPGKDKDSNGDSPLGLLGSGEPRAGCSWPDRCSHGTHVAGIAAGGGLPSQPQGFHGVAPDAEIVSVQVFSYAISDPSNVEGFYVDLLAAFNRVIGAMISGLGNPYTINISIASPALYPNSCQYVSSDMANAVALLANFGVPTIAATGNASARFGIGLPACLPGVIKVGAVDNSSIGSTLSNITNLADPAAFGSDYFWLAPGGGFGVQSAAPGPVDPVSGWATTVRGNVGTSMSTPHVAGAYTLLKQYFPGMTIPWYSAWIRDNASEDISPTTLTGGKIVVFQRLRVR